MKKIRKTSIVSLLLAGTLLTSCGISQEDVIKDAQAEPIKDELVSKFKKDMDTAEETKEVKEETKEVKEETKQAPKPEAKPEPKPEPKVEKKSMEQIVAEVKQGKWDSGEDRKTKLTKAGYDYSEVQSEVNKSMPEPTPAPVSKTESSGETASESNENASNYQANRIYIGGSSMPMMASDLANLQDVVDETTYTWISRGSYSPSDNLGTFFGMHSHTGGSVIYGMQTGDSFIVTDSSGNPHTYVVEKVYVQNKQEYFDDELRGDLNKEYVVLQTSEPYVNGHRNGNRHVIAVKND